MKPGAWVFLALIAGFAAGGCSTPTTFGGLVVAGHPECASGAQQLARYLDVGKPTSLDVSAGDLRQHALGLSGERRALYIRQTADAYIATCDRDATARRVAASASAVAGAAAQSRAADYAAFKRRMARRTASCGQLAGATWVESQFECQIFYPLPADGAKYPYIVTFDDNGNVVDEQPGVTNPSECATHFPGRPGVWHADTKICSR